MKTKMLRVDVWSDILCPWCAIGKRRLDAALADFPHRDAVQVVWRSFELDPSAPRVRDGDPAEHLAKKYGRTKAEAEAMIQRVVDIASREGLDFRLLRARSGNTFDGHRLLHLALERGLQGAVKDRLLRAYMTEGLPIGEREVLVRLAAETGLDAEEARAALAGNRYAKEVRDDENAARALGITGVPFFVFGGRLAVSGAQEVAILSQAMREAWGGVRETAGEEGPTCGPDGCA